MLLQLIMAKLSGLPEGRVKPGLSRFALIWRLAGR